MNRSAGKIIKRVFDVFGMDIAQTSSNVFQQTTHEEVLAKIDSPFRTPLLSMYRGEPQRGIDGKFHPIKKIVSISPQQGLWLYELCRFVKPKSTLEVGLAYGYSALYFLVAATKNQMGYHTAIDPFQYSYFLGKSLAHAKALAPRRGNESAFRYIEDSSDRAATDLARKNCTYDLIFIDGNHRFDDVLVDFYLYAQLCTIGGYIIFDDIWLSSVKTAVAFVRANRSDFTEIPSTEPNISVSQKKGEDKRAWYEFHEFQVAPSLLHIDLPPECSVPAATASGR